MTFLYLLANLCSAFCDSNAFITTSIGEASPFIFSRGFGSDAWSNFSTVRLLAFHLSHGFLNISEIDGREGTVKQS